MKRIIPFTKMHGAGNDYVYVYTPDNPIENPEELSILWSDRHKGIGGDGLILIGKSDVADFSMRMFNNDGSEGMMCGNGTRCIAKYVYDKGLTNKTVVTLETLSGISIFILATTDWSKALQLTWVNRFLPTRSSVQRQMGHFATEWLKLGEKRIKVHSFRWAILTLSSLCRAFPTSTLLARDALWKIAQCFPNAATLNL